MDRLSVGARARIGTDDGSDVVGRLRRVDDTGLCLQLLDGSESFVAKERIVELHVQRPRFPRIGESLLGFAIGTMAGAFLAATNQDGFHPDDADGAFPPSIYRHDAVLLGAVTGLVVGTAIPLIYPGEDKVECAWTAAPPDDEFYSEASRGREHGFVRIGALAGATYAYTDWDYESDGVKPFGGVRSEYVLRNGLGAQIGLQYSPKGYAYDPIIPEDKNGALSFKYIAAPARIIYRFREDRHLPSVLALGIEGAYLLSADYRVEDFDGNVRSREITDDMERWDLGVSLGSAIAFGRSMEIGLEYVYGLRGTINPDARNRSLWLFTSVWLDLS